jgi:hypothetical protein
LVVVLGALAFGLTACSLPVSLGGGQVWIIEVENTSDAPARLAVAEDGLPRGDIVGTANPESVPAGETVEVTFTVPPGEGWAIFVNAVPVLVAQDFSVGEDGRLRLHIFVRPDGSSTVAIG